jgi:cadmium resistance protein CadD (predicted permease)
MDFELFMGTANEFIALLTGLLGLISAGVGLYFAIKNWCSAIKERTSAERWKLIMEMADAAMKEAEATAASGEDKKTIVINAVNAACLAAGIDSKDFAEQLDQYIDQTIEFVKRMNQQKQLIDSK